MRQPELVDAESTWIFDPISVRMMARLIDKVPTILWDTDNLLTTIKLAYALVGILFAKMPESVECLSVEEARKVKSTTVDFLWKALY